MATLTIIKFFFNLLLITLGAYALLHEKELARFERKVVKYIKAFFKALYLTLKEKRETEVQVTPIKLPVNDEYAEMLQRLNKSSNVEDVLVA